MQKDLLMFWDWAKGVHLENSVRKSAPEGWRIHELNFQYLVDKGWVEKLADTVSTYLDKKDLKKVHVMGHSLGGALAMQFARARPERVEHLYLLDSAGVYEPRPFWELCKDVIRQDPESGHGSFQDKQMMRAIFRNPLLYIKLGRYAYRADLENEAMQIKVPTTILWGQDDPLTRIEQGEKLHKLIPHSKFVVLRKQTHDWPMTHPKLFWDHVV